MEVLPQRGGARDLSRIDVHTLKIHNIIKEKEGGKWDSRSPRASSLTFERIELPTNFVRKNNAQSEGDGERVLIESPLSAELEIEADLGDAIAFGGSGSIYMIEVQTSVSALSDGGDPIKLPPLVCKFAALEHNKSIAREAWFYDELQALQGSVIPRCFGLFQAVVPEESEFVPRVNDNRHPEESPSSFLDSERQPDATRYIGEFNDPDCELLLKMGNRRCVTVLLMERLGEGFIPDGGLVSDDMKKEVLSAYSELVAFDINHGEFYPPNILSVFNSEDAFEGKKTPRDKLDLKCRIVGFVMACKTLNCQDSIQGLTEAELGAILGGLPENYKQVKTACPDNT